MPEPRSFPQGASVDPPSPVCHCCSALGLPHPGRGRCAFRRGSFGLDRSPGLDRSGFLVEDLDQERGRGDGGPEPSVGAVLEEPELELRRPGRGRRDDSRPQEGLVPSVCATRASPTSTPASRAMAGPRPPRASPGRAPPRARTRPALERRHLGQERPSAPCVPASTIAIRPRPAGRVRPPGPPRTSRPPPGRTLEGRPDVGPVAASTSAAGRAHRPSARLVDGRDPDVEPVGPGVGRDDRVRGAEHRLAQALGDVRLADAVGPQRPDDAPVAEAPLEESRQDPVAPHRAQLARRAREEDDDPPVGPIHPPAGRRAVRVRDRGRRRDEPGLLEVDLGQRIPRRSKRPRSQASRSGSIAGTSPTAAATASRVRSSGVGPRPPVATTRSAAARASPNAPVTSARSSGSATIRRTATP